MNLYYLHIDNSFRMEGPTEDELDKLSAVGGKYKTKNQVHDRRGQVHSISCNFKSGQKLPLVVKYPPISRFYEKLQRDHEWAQFRMGVYNGMFIVPDIPDTGQFSIPSVKIKDYDPVQEFFCTPQYKLLVKTLNLMYKRLRVTVGGTVYDERNEDDMSYDETIIKYGK